MLLKIIAFAWKNLTYQKTHFYPLVGAIGFAVVILYSQILFLNGLLETQARIALKFNGDLVLMSKKNTDLFSSSKIHRQILHQALAYDAVESATPVHFSTLKYKYKKNEAQEPIIFVMAFPVLNLPVDFKAPGNIYEKLKSNESVIFDKDSLNVYGDVKIGNNVWIANTLFQVDGFINFGPSFTYDGMVLMGEGGYARMLGPRALNKTSYGIIKLKPGTNVETVRRKLMAGLPSDIKILTPKEIYVREKDYTNRNAPLSLILGVGLVIGGVIALIISYGVVHNEIEKNINQYATLKALGFSNRYLRLLIVASAGILGFLGFCAGSIGGWIFYFIAKHLTDIFFVWRWRDMLIFLLLILIIAVVSGLFASKKLKKLDPASLF